MTCFNPEQCEHRPKTNQKSSLVFLLALPLSQSVLGLQSKQSKRQRKNLSTTSDCSTSTAPTLRASSPESEFPAAKLYCEFTAGHSSLLVFTSLSSLFFLVTPMFPSRRYKSPLRSSLRRFSGLVANIPRKWDKRMRDASKSPLCAFTAAQRCRIRTMAWSSWRTLRKNTLQQDVGEQLCPYEILPLVIISRSRWRSNCTSSLSARARKYFTPSEFFAFLKYNGEGGGVQVLSIQRGKPRSSDLVPYLIDTCPCSPAPPPLSSFNSDQRRLPRLRRNETAGN